MEIFVVPIAVFSKIFKNSQKQPFIGVFTKRCSEIIQQIYKRALMTKCNFNKATKQLY